MFQGCTILETAPTLPVETLASSCYQNMFRDCTHLNTAPALPATTLAERCYQDMFHGCTQLTTSPALPATTLVDYCYDNMFQGCSNLNRVTCLATNFQLTSQYTTCTYNWLYGVAATGTFVKPETMNDWPTGPYTDNVNGIPVGWAAMSYETMTTPLTFEAKTAGAEVTFSKGPNVTLNDLEYSIDNGANWSTYTFGTPISLTNEGDKVSFRGNNAAYANANDNCKFSCSASCYLYGNIMSLVDKDDFATNTKLTGTYAFAYLFSQNSNLYCHPSKMLVLPATTLTPHCYYAMFEG